MKKIILILAFFSIALNAQKIEVFAASSTSKLMLDLKAHFLKTCASCEINFVFGASGKHYQLLRNGRKFDLFFSADSKYPEQIQKDSLALLEPKVYALGILALYFSDEKLLKDGLNALTKLRYISIANPRLAPYGEAALQILKNTGLYEKVKNKLILGENVSQALMYVDTKVAEVAILAYSLLVDKEKSKVLLINKSLYEPLRHSFVLTKYLKKDPKKEDLALKFSNFVLSKQGKEIIKKHGFDVE